jgi:hypothetical protein
LKKLVAPGLVIVAGLVFIIVTLVQNLFPVGNDFEEMIDDFRPILTDASIGQLRTDLGGLGAVAEEFRTQVAPGMAQQLGMTPEAFGQFVQTEFPAVATGLALLPEAGPTFSGLIDILDQQQDNFASADQIPTKDFPAQTVPWGFTIIGVLAIALGVYLFMRPSRLGAILAIVLGLLIVVGSLVLTLPGKSADADDLNEALYPVYTVETVEGAKGALSVIGAMGQEMSASMLPALAQQLGMGPEELGGFLAQNFPATAQGLQTLPDALGRFGNLVQTFDANLDNYDTLEPVRFTPIIWTFIIGGLVIAIAGGFALYSGRKDETMVAPAMHPEA